MNNVLQVDAITKSYSTPHGEYKVLNGINFTIQPKQSLAISGASGSGKSTLLHIIAGLMSPSSGTVVFEDIDIGRASEQELSALRLNSIGFLFQKHHLINELSVFENIALPLIIAGRKDEESSRVSELLADIGMKSYGAKYPHELSYGERQRVALARAMVMNPKILIADEPTGNLDWKNKDAIIHMMLEITQKRTASLIAATHDKSLVDSCQLQRELSKGYLK